MKNFDGLITFFKKGNNLVILVFFIFTCLLAVVFRMKSIEQDYQISKKRKRLERLRVE